MQPTLQRRDPTHTPTECVRVIESLGEFAAFAAGSTFQGESRKPSSRSWDLDTDFDGAVKLAREGWTHGAPRVDRFDGEVDRLLSVALGHGGQGVETMADWTHTHEGGKGEIDMGAYLDGDPECIIALEPLPYSSALVLYVDVTSSYNVLASTIAERGSLILSLVDLLHKRGVLIELWVGARATSVWTYGLWTRVKRTTEPVDQGQLAYAIAHPTFTRRLLFAAMESEDFRDKIGVNRSYGSPITSETDLTAMPDSFYERSGIAACALLPGINTSWTPKRDVDIMDKAGFFAALKQNN